MTDLTQAEADALLAMHKRRLENRPYQLPDLGGRLFVPLESLDAREASRFCAIVEPPEFDRSLFA